MTSTDELVRIATRGSALALAQANQVLAQCQAAFPKLHFELKIIKTTGDKLQSASLAKENEDLPKGLFTKELETALLEQHADIAVHSLKDLPTELPAGLKLGAVGKRADARDVLIYREEEYLRAENEKTAHVEPPHGHAKRRGFKHKLEIGNLPQAASVATSSTRRKAQLLASRPDLKVVEIRGNVPTRLRKLADHADLDATLLAAAGLERLKFEITREGKLRGEGVPDGLLATLLEPDVMLPCVGQGAIGIEVRAEDERLAKICDGLNHPHTRQCVTAERAFLAAMGGGCQSPVAAYAEILSHYIWLRAISLREGEPRRADATAALKDAVALGEKVAAMLK